MSVAVSADQAVRERLDDLNELLREAGHGRRSRVELTRALVFACPTDDPEHVTRIIRYGTLRLYEDCGWDNTHWVEEAEGELGWYADTVDRSALVDELAHTRRELQHMRWHLLEALKTLRTGEDPQAARERARGA